MHKGTFAQGSPVDYGLIHTNPLKGEGAVRWRKTGGCQGSVLGEENTFGLLCQQPAGAEQTFKL